MSTRCGLKGRLPQHIRALHPEVVEVQAVCQLWTEGFPLGLNMTTAYKVTAEGDLTQYALVAIPNALLLPALLGGTNG